MLGLSIGLLIGLVVVLGALAAVVDLIAPGTAETGRAAPFDAARWRENAGCARLNPRWHMVRDVQARLLPGMTRAEVTALLGPADEVQPDQLLYYLGYWSGARMDPDYLHVRFDASGRLASTAVLQH